MPAPLDPAQRSRPPSPGATSLRPKKTHDVTANPTRSSAGYRVSIEAANISIESDFPITSLSLFDNDLTLQIDCEGAARATILLVPISGKDLPSVLLSDHPDGPMTSGQPTLEGRLFEVICGVPVGITWDPKRTHRTKPDRSTG
jgi:hypothetical protein